MKTLYSLTAGLLLALNIGCNSSTQEVIDKLPEKKTTGYEYIRQTTEDLLVQLSEERGCISASMVKYFEGYSADMAQEKADNEARMLYIRKCRASSPFHSGIELQRWQLTNKKDPTEGYVLVTASCLPNRDCSK